VFVTVTGFYPLQILCLSQKNGKLHERESGLAACFDYPRIDRIDRIDSLGSMDKLSYLIQFKS
jgi:hypothetical protein